MSPLELRASATSHVGAMGRRATGWHHGFTGSPTEVQARVERAWARADFVIASGSGHADVNLVPGRERGQIYVVVNMPETVGRVTDPAGARARDVNAIAFELHGHRLVATFPTSARREQRDARR